MKSYIIYFANAKPVWLRPHGKRSRQQAAKYLNAVRRHCESIDVRVDVSTRRGGAPAIYFVKKFIPR